MAKTEVNLTKFTKNHTMTVKVNVTRRLKLRLFIAIALIKVASWILNWNIEIENSESH